MKTTREQLCKWLNDERNYSAKLRGMILKQKEDLDELDNNKVIE